MNKTTNTIEKTEILREKAKKLYQHGISVAEMAEILDMPYMLICKWTKGRRLSRHTIFDAYAYVTYETITAR